MRNYDKAYADAVRAAMERPRREPDFRAEVDMFLQRQQEYERDHAHTLAVQRQLKNVDRLKKLK